MKNTHPDYSPTQINVDFELAAINAAKEVFPNATIQGCLFHYAQSIGRNLNQNDLKARYENDLQFAHEIREMAAVAFLPPMEVILEYNLEWTNIIWNTFSHIHLGRIKVAIIHSTLRNIERNGTVRTRRSQILHP